MSAIEEARCYTGPVLVFQAQGGARMERPEPNAASGRGTLALWQRLTLETCQMLRFYSRLPIPSPAFETDSHAAPDFRIAARMIPVAALVIALPTAAAMAFASALWLPAMLIGLIGIATGIVVTGALHEDGLADTADGIGGGRTVEDRLRIMRDSSIGSYGAVALMLTLSGKATAISALIDRQGAEAAILCVVAAAILSRTLATWPHWLLPPAREDGKAARVGRPGTQAVVVAVILALGFSLVALRGFGLAKLLVAILAAAGMALVMMRLAQRKLGGHTGDVIGATQQICEITLLVALNVSFYR
ncbi:MAG: adenosylcobinamide-GDP ribazoletransferase [Beijerinckiaceae bacterium]|nr:adenosylcobinamide-GDP ribazoletransferase [Beijerinckiaceae bacterium]